MLHLSPCAGQLVGDCPGQRSKLLACRPASSSPCTKVDVVRPRGIRLLKYLELLSCLLGKGTASYCPQMCFQVWAHGGTGIICMAEIQKEITALIRMVLCSKRSSFSKEPVYFI